MKKICVFCGSAHGNSKQYVEQAENVGRILLQRGWGLVYGGGKVGIMGTIANTVLAGQGEVIGVIPESLVSKEVAHMQVTKLHIVPDMHTRKKMMYDLSDAFLILPGGMGTLDEMFEILTWSQLGLHKKPIYILNEFGFYDHLLNYIRHSQKEGFIKPEHLRLINVINKPEDVLSIRL
jgi:uncharacterized protein (TIGR00730 family)